MKKLVTILFAALFYWPTVSAQLCQGSLGPAIKHTTFGSGTNPGAPLAASSTNYNYITNDCPSDGSYSIRNSSVGCFNSTWHTLNTDHTGDAGGYFMLVNASFTAGDFYVDTVRGLCAGTTFEFAAWVINMLKPSFCTPPILPNLTFRIERTDGSLLQSYNTGDIASVPTVQWQQIGFFFTTPAGVTDVVLRISNNASGGCGNDLALDDITFRPCGPLLTPSIIGQNNTTASYCQGPAGNYVLNCNVSAGFINPAFQWQFNMNGGPYMDIAGANNSSMAVFIPAGTPPTLFTYRLLAAEAGNITNPSCRIASPLLTIRIDSIPKPVLNTNSPLCNGQDLQLMGGGGGQYNWTGPAGFVNANASATLTNASPAASGRYYLQVRSSFGCTGIDSADVVINSSPTATVSFTSAVICQGDNVQLSATGGTVYNWSPAAGLSSSVIANPIASPQQNTNYQVVVANAFNCTDTAFVQVQVQNTAIANAGPDKITIAGIPVQLQGSASGDNISYQWSPAQYLNDPFILSPILQNAPPGEYNYRLTVTSACGTAEDGAKITVYKDLYIPTAFTPNNDGRNDKWIIAALSAYRNINMAVYNRYGMMVYQNSNPQAGWDGTMNGVPQPTGIYVYKVVVAGPAGEKTYQGTISLIR